MPAPSSSLATQRPDLASNFQFDLEAEKAGYIAPFVLPVVEVASQAGNFGKIPLAQLLEERDTERASGSGYARGEFTFDPATYACVEHGAEEPIDDRDKRLYADYFDLEVVATSRAYSTVLRNAEKRAAAAIFNTTTWAGAALTTAVSNAWSSASSGLPVTDVEAAVQKVYTGSGLWPNALICNRKVFRNLRLNAQIIARIESGGAGNSSAAGKITEAMIAEVLGLDMIIVAGGSKNTANKGQTATPAQIWSDSYAMVCKVATTGDMREPCIGRTFHWGEDGSSIGGTVETYREEAIRGDVVRVRHEVDEVVLYSAAGHLLSNIT